MKKPDPAKLLKDVEDIARLAGAEILVHYNKGTNVYIKADNSPVTDADQAAEDIILPKLAALTPGVPIVSEEAMANGAAPDVSGGTFWTVDPLDGTKEFIDKTGAFLVAISLIVDNKPVLGVVYHPAFDVMYSAAGPGTATRTGADGSRMTLDAGSNPKQSASNDMRVVINEKSANMPLVKGRLSQQFGKAAKIDGTSGIARACQVADNTAEVLIIQPVNRNGRTKWWDVAPGHAIIEAAGGHVEDLTGKPLVYDAPDFQVPPHISLSPAHMARQAARPENEPENKKASGPPPRTKG
jgi:3'(2'), 5'-bisphosphate nucleotidase